MDHDPKTRRAADTMLPKRSSSSFFRNGLPQTVAALQAFAELI